ncbi:MAG: hypothetical protein NTZ16_13625, partial [Verrucomicrobia bacterium]|nr:hypothetical protein [Verrucomicrobiota bacterium]
DDPFKTVLGNDGGLYYGYTQEGAETYSCGAGVFGTRILASVESAGAVGAKQQSLHSARVPVVTTRQQVGALEIEQVAWANAPTEKSVAARSAERTDFLWVKVRNTGAAPAVGQLRLDVGTTGLLELDKTRSRLVLDNNPAETFCSFSRPCSVSDSDAARPALLSLQKLRVHRNWSKPQAACAETFRHIFSSSKPMDFEVAAATGRKYVVALGLVEGYHTEPGKRVMEILLNDQSVATVDMVKQHGTNVPVVLMLPATGGDADGLLRLTVKAGSEARDKNVSVSGLWIYLAESAPPKEKILAGEKTPLPLAFVDANHPAALPSPKVLRWDLAGLPAGGQFDLLVSVPQGEKAKKFSGKFTAEAELARAVKFWENADLPYGKIEVPDAAVQALLDSCIRNIYQAREIKNGLPAFQVGPTMYRGLWVVDGSFLLETATMLGRTREARQGIDYLMSFQHADGGFEIIPTHWKESGIVLWAVTRQARLTGDKQWLLSWWPKLEKCWAFIRVLRERASADPQALYAGLISPGMSDGGLHGPSPEYTNIHWTMAGMRAAIEAALWLGKREQADAWRKEYDDFAACFHRAAERDMRDDGHGNRCLPITMNSPTNIPVQKAQWAFLHAVYPGEVFAPQDEIVRGNMAMLRANECEGLVWDTGWLEEGLWTYFGSFYGHAWLWLGEGRKAATTLYAFGNHASPLMCWREEQMPLGKNPTGKKRAYVGDMPHNWASAEFIRLAVHLLELDRGDELHLLEGFPREWAAPGMVTKLNGVATPFGPLQLEVRVAKDGWSARLKLAQLKGSKPAKIVLHLNGLTGKPETVSLPTDRDVNQTFAIQP